MTALARTTDPATSHAATTSVNRRNSRDVVYSYLLALGPMTHKTLEHLCRYEPNPQRPWEPQRIRTACNELVTLGLVRDTGRTERLRSGRHAVVWEVCP